ncbi:MAG: ASKHA domain-containing protein [Anaerolineales bacterium]|jgi:uncharacterized 2Fe-2S/4Fe-4S cluster protein (DUF4445 family)
MEFRIEFEPLGVRLICDEPVKLSEAARRAGVSLRAECGGNASCGQCRVRVESKQPPVLTDAERKIIPADELAEGWRLACRTVVSENARVYIPPTSLTTEQCIQTEGEDRDIRVCCNVRTLSITVPPPSLSDQIADDQRVMQVLENQGDRCARIGIPAINMLSAALREGSWQVTLGLHGDEIIAAYPGTDAPLVGLAVDIGTTKLACYLVDLTTGKTLAAKGLMNPQIAHGEDVMSRLEAVLLNGLNGTRMQEETVQAINAAAQALCKTQDLRTSNLLDICFVGNTAMHHLLLGLPVQALAVSPFIATVGSPLEIDACTLGLESAHGAKVYLAPPIAGFVGSDHLAFLMAANFGQDERIRLGIDIGTNTEIALQVGNRIVSCSTASGPAFEGAHIQCGMRAAPGAIERVKIEPDGSTICGVIGDQPAVGICGSGVLDALAEMRKVGLINKRGRIQSESMGVQRNADGKLAFKLTVAGDGAREICINQRDIDQILLAKGAIRAGIDILLDYLDIQAEEINEVVLAGAFGTYLDPFNAMRIGLLPRLPLTRVHAIGNAAGTGACMLLASTQARQEACQLAERIEYLELTIYPAFNRFFALGVRLPKA